MNPSHLLTQVLRAHLTYPRTSTIPRTFILTRQFPRAHTQNLLIRKMSTPSNSNPPSSSSNPEPPSTANPASTPTTPSTTANTSHPAPLPLPAPDPETQSTQLDVNGQSVKLDHLGPLVVNRDGTLSRIANWEGMTEIERQNTLRILGKRNQLRLGDLRGEGEEESK